MRVVWVSPVLLPAQLAYMGSPAPVRAGWISSLLHAVRGTSSPPEMAVLAIGGCRAERAFDADGVSYHILPWRLGGGARAERDALRRAASIVSAFGADLVHVHGTEGHLAELAVGGRVPVPVVVSIQGLRFRCAPHLFAGLKPLELVRWQLGAHDILSRQGPLFVWLSWRRWARLERRVLAGCSHFIGRTIWDRANALAMNPHARYYHGGEIMRPEFYQPGDVGDAAPAYPPVLLAGRATPLKGITVLLDALAILRRRGIPFRARIFGRLPEREGLARVLRGRIGRLGLDRDIVFLGTLSSDAVAREMVRAAVYLHPSFMDNSPNTVAEAQLVGLPVVASDCGGVASMIRHDETGLLVPPGDPEVLAEQTIELLAEPGRATRIARQAQQEARVRHDSALIAAELLATYAAICAGAATETRRGRDSR